jgi:hypothetical protein
MVEAYQKYQELQDEHQVFSYCGPINMVMITHLMNLSDGVFKMYGLTTKQKKRIINVFIEVLQNVMYHAEQSPDHKQGRECIIMIRKNGEGFLISTGNYIPNKYISSLRKRLDRLSPLTLEELNQQYLQTLNEGAISAKGGAGLGLMRILMISKTETIFEFEKINEEFSFFSMNIMIRK